jgi:hypothetical protein
MLRPFFHRRLRTTGADCCEPNDTPGPASATRSACALDSALPVTIVTALLAVTLILAAACESRAQTGQIQLWDVVLAITIPTGPLPTSTTIPVAVPASGTFSQPTDTTVVAGPCTFRVVQSFMVTFDTAVNLRIEATITATPPSDPQICPDSSVVISSPSGAPLDQPFPSATTTTGPGTLSALSGGQSVFVGTFTAVCRSGCAQPEPAIVTSVTGSASVIVQGVQAALGSGSPVVKGAVVTTGTDGQVQGGCADGSQFVVGPDSRLFLDDSLCQQSGSGTVDLAQGQFSFATGPGTSQAARRAADPSTFGTSVRTPVSFGRMTSDGTQFSTTYTQLGRTGTATTTVTAGAVDVTDATTGAVTTVIAGQHITIAGSTPEVVAAMLPISRSVRVPTPATVFGSLINADTAKPAIVCGISPITDVPGATFSFQTTDPATNEPVGTKSTPVSIPPGGTQPFVITMAPTLPFPPTEVQFGFACAGTQAPIMPGLNTLLLSASTSPVPDIVALAATVGGAGIVTTSGPAASGAFAVATVNVGASALITASADTGNTSLPLSISLCQTDPATGSCVGSAGASVSTQIAAGATPTFAVFVAAGSSVAFDPATHRIFVRFRDDSGATRGSTSVAVRTE